MGVADHAGVDVYADGEAVARAAADFLIDRALEAVEARGTFRLALSGGSTPKRLYQILAGPDYRDRFPWASVELFFGDERFVPHDDERSNVHMARLAMLDEVPIPAANVHIPPYGDDPAAAAAAYQRDLQQVYGSDTLNTRGALFDVVLLGLGENGHTASLFPRTGVLDVTDAWVGWCTPDDAPNDRLTLTYPAIDSSACVLFLVVGAGKHEVLGRVLDGDRTQPAARITSRGEIRWFIDRAAAGDAS